MARKKRQFRRIPAEAGTSSPLPDKDLEAMRRVRLMVGDNIRNLRISRAMSQEDLARAVEQAGGTASSFRRISLWERGCVSLSMKNMTALARALGVNMAKLFEERTS